MQLASEFDAGHDDLVLDMAFNYYGTRMVTCSSDHKIKVWELVEHEWRLCDSWKGHDSAVLKVSWAHPSFGQLFCSCSYDKSIKVWEEQEQEQTLGSRRWIERAKLGQSKSMVQDVQFAPHYLGLKIASISADGMMMIYDAADPMKVSSWNLSDAFEVVNIATREPDIKYAFSWCQSKFQPPMMAVSSGREQPVRIFRLDQQNHWQPYESLLGNAGIVRSVAWAPNMGRSYQLIATASSDGSVKIYHLISKKDLQSKQIFSVECVADFKDHHSEVVQVEWNTTGTILSSCGDDGVVRLWKSLALKQWKQIGEIFSENK